MSVTAIKRPGCYDMPAEAYHADPCRVPSLSRSIAHLLLTRSPRHAWASHPRLNAAAVPKNAKHMDFGAVAHALMLNDNAPIRVIRSPNFKGFAAQKARELAYAAGQIPILEADYARAQHMVKTGRAQLSLHEDAHDAFLEGKAEQTLIWKEKIDGTWVWCRARCDWLQRLGGWIEDYKTTQGAASPGAWGRYAFAEGLDLQDALYRRGYQAVFGVKPAGFRFIVQETDPPHALSVCAFDPAAGDMAMRKVENALSLWAWCTKNDKWPGYAGRIHYMMPPIWAEKEWTEREEREQLAKADGEDLRAQLMDWQAPLDRKGKQ